MNIDTLATLFINISRHPTMPSDMKLKLSKLVFAQKDNDLFLTYIKKMFEIYEEGSTVDRIDSAIAAIHS
mgnify:CR=1 FL=1|jgi:hypothetical protein